MKKIIQKAEVVVVKPAIIRYFCDYCGKRLDRKNPKETRYDSETGEDAHYCKKRNCYEKSNEAQF